MKAPINIGVQAGTKMLRIQRQEAAYRHMRLAPDEIEHEDYGYWIVWLNTRDFIIGTYLKFYDDGMIERVTILEDQPAPYVVLIKPIDGE